MDLTDINDLAERAERHQEDIIEFSVRYSRALDGYQHSEAGEVPGELDDVSAQELYRETTRFVAQIEKHENRLEELEQAARALERISDHRFIPDSELSKDQVKNYLGDVYSSHRENLDHAWDVVFRAEQVEEAPSPMRTRSDLKRDFEPFEENMEMLVALEKGY